MAKPVIIVILEQLIKFFTEIGRLLSALFATPFSLITFILTSILPQDYPLFIYHFFVVWNFIISYLLIGFAVSYILSPSYIYWKVIPVSYENQRFMFILKCLYLPVHFCLTMGSLSWGTYVLCNDFEVTDYQYARRYEHSGYWSDIILFLPVDIVVIALSFVCAILNPVRYYYFMKRFGRRRRYDGRFTIYYMRNIGKTILDYITLPFILLVYVIPIRLHYILDLENARYSHKFFTHHGICTIYEFPVFLFTFVMVFVTLYRIPSFLKEFYNKTAPERFEFCLKTLHTIIVDLPHVAGFFFLLLTIWRSGFIYRGETSRQKIRTEVALMLMDILCIPLVIPIVLVIFRISELKSAWRCTDDEKEKRFKLYSLGIFSLLDLIVHLLFGLPLLIFTWRIYFTVPYWKKADNNQKSLVILKQFGLLLMDFPCTFFFLIVLITIYRFQRMRRFWRKKNSYHLAASWEILGIICDIPFIFLGILTLWRLPILLNNIVLYCGSITKAREEVLGVLKETCVDILFVISSIFLILSVYHIFRMYYLYKTSNSYRRAIIKVCVYELPVNIMSCIFTYGILLTLIRIPVTIRHISRTNGSKNHMKNVVRIHFLALGFDFLAIGATVIICCILWWRIKRLWRIYNSKKFFVIDPAYLFWNTVTTQIEIINVLRGDFFKGVKQLLLFFLCCTASITIWRARKIFYIVFFWKSSKNPLTTFRKKLMYVLGENMLTLLEPFCFVLMIILLCSWRSLYMVGFLRLRWKENRMRVLHWDILKEFVEFIVDLPFLFMWICLIITNYRIPVMYQFYFVEDHGYGHRAFLFYEFKQLIFDSYLIIIALLCVIITPFRIPTFIKVLYLEYNDKRKRLKLHLIIAKTIVDLFTLGCSIFTLLFFWRLPVFIYQYCYLRNFTRFRKCVFDQAVYGFLDILSVIQVIGIFFFLFDVVEWLISFVHVVQQFCHNRKKTFDKYMEIRRIRKKRKQRKHFKHNGQVLPNELLFSVFSFVDMNTLFRCSRVCKHWKQVCSRDMLWEFHFNRMHNRGEDTRPKKKHGNIYLQVFQDAYGETYYKSCLHEMERRWTRRVKPRKTIQEIEYEKGLRVITLEYFFHSLLSFPYSYPCFQLKLLGILLLPIHLFNEFTNSWGFYLYLRIFKRLRTDQIRPIRRLPEGNFLAEGWKSLHKYCVLCIATFLGLMIYYGVIILDFSLFLFMFAWFLGAPLWIGLVSKIPWIFKSPVDLFLKVMMTLSIPIIIVFFLNIFITPFFFNVRIECLKPLQGYIDWEIDVVTPFYFQTYEFLKPIVINLTDQIIVALYSNRILEIVFSWILFCGKVHLLAIWFEGVIVQWLFSFVIVRFLLIDSWFSKIAFPFVWGYFWYYSMWLYARLYIRRFFPWFNPTKAAAEVFTRSLTDPTFFCFSKLGGCGELLIIPYVITWVFWPVALSIYFNKWLFLIPSIIASILLLLAALDFVEKVNRDVSQLRQKKL